MVGQVIASAAFDGQINERTEASFRLRASCCISRHVQIENRAGPSLACPSQHGEIISFNQPHRAVNHICTAFAGTVAAALRKSASLCLGT